MSIHPWRQRDKPRKRLILEPFDAEAVCPMCAHPGVSAQYRSDDCTDESCSICAQPHQARTCQRCRYWWPQAVTAAAAERFQRQTSQVAP